MLTASHFQPEHDPRLGGTTGNWFFAFPEDPDVIVRGTESGPTLEDIARANAALSNLDALRLRATALLEDFMRDKGAWHLATLDCGVKAERLECSFILSFAFTADRDPYEYGYTYFDVCFVVPEHGHPKDLHGRPTKFVVGFH